MKGLTARLLLAIVASAALHGQAFASNGTVVATTKCAPTKQSYREWLADKEKEYKEEADTANSKFGIIMRPFSALASALPSAEEFKRRRNDKSHTCERITYLSEGLKVTGYIWRPSDTDGRKRPLIVYNRGGGQELGRLTPTMRDGFYDFLKAGFVVIGSQYRGNDGGDGHDEEGGAETADVLNLVQVAASLDYIDTSNVFMLGESRGGMTTFLAIKNGARLNAAAVVGAESDLAANIKRRPELDPDNAKQIPGYRDDTEKALRDRSAQEWPSAINAPVLMLQGGKDWRVPPSQALGLAMELDTYRRPFELTVFDDDDHPLSFHWRERDDRIIRWFKNHLNGSAHRTK